MNVLRSLIRDESGVALTEYALALALIGVAAILALAGIAVACSTTFNDTSSSMQTFTTNSPP